MMITHSVDTASIRVIGTDLRFPEGPVALDDGSVLVAELAGAVVRIDADGTLTRYETGGGINGAALGPDGALYLANNGGVRLIVDDAGIAHTKGGLPHNQNYDQGRIERFDLDTGRVETLTREVEGRPLGWLNDIVFDASGGCYVVDTTTQGVCYVDGRTGSGRWVITDVAVPNGAALSPDGSRLYLSETFGDILVWDVLGPGELDNRRVHFAHQDDHGWDGLAVDGAGNVCVANLERSGISVISSEGQEVGSLVTTQYDPVITNICFGGPEGRTAYVCSAGRGLLYAVDWPWGGLRLNFAR